MHNRFDALRVYLAESEAEEDVSSDVPPSSDADCPAWFASGSNSPFSSSSPLSASLDVPSAESSDPVAGQSRLDKAAQKWTRAVRTVFASQNVYRRVKRRRPGPLLSKSLRRAIRKRRKAFRTLRKLESGSVELQEAIRHWKELRQSSAQRVAQERRAGWRKKMEKAGLDLKENPGLVWSVVRRLAGWKPRGDTGIQPIFDNDSGTLAVEPDRIRVLWHRHYTQLHADVTGHSRNAEFWEGKFPQCDECLRLAMAALNPPFTTQELDVVLRRVKRGKAPGMDGIPADVYALLANLSAETPMGLALLDLLNAVYKSGTIPTSWNMSVLVPIFKKGDPSLPANYQGISLINTMLKLLCLLLLRRLNRVVEEQKLLRPHQAGFQSIRRSGGTGGLLG